MDVSRQSSQYANMLKNYENYTCVESLYMQADAFGRQNMVIALPLLYLERMTVC